MFKKIVRFFGEGIMFKVIPCPNCDGTKIDPETGEKCKDCNGTGEAKVQLTGINLLKEIRRAKVGRKR